MQKVKFELNNGKSMTVELYPEHAPISQNEVSHLTE